MPAWLERSVQFTRGHLWHSHGFGAAPCGEGFQVTGSDQNVYPPMSTFLAERGIEVMEDLRNGTSARSPTWW